MSKKKVQDISLKDQIKPIFKERFTQMLDSFNVFILKDFLCGFRIHSSNLIYSSCEPNI
jgi:hypothetical protein